MRLTIPPILEGDRNMKKKNWDTPQLIVLARSKPEEALLVGCKHFEIEATPGASVGGCTNPLTPPACQDCSLAIAS
jgi:hypothetical protein